MKKLLIIYLIFFSLAIFAKNSALVIIDMQPYFATRSGFDKSQSNKDKLAAALKKQVELIEMAKKSNIPIVVIEYDLSAWYKEANVEFKTSSTLTDALGNYPNQTVIKKNQDGMFSSYNSYLSTLKKYLDDQNVDQLIVTGANGGACVLASIQGAVENHYKVIAVSDAIADLNYEDFIYPYQYDQNYSGIDTSSCSPNCSFKQMTDIPQILLTVSTNKGEKSSQSENDSSRNSNKGTHLETVSPGVQNNSNVEK